MQIRSAHIADISQIAEISISSSRNAYRGILPDAVLDGLSVSEIERSWADRFETTGRWALIAEEEGQIRGMEAASGASQKELRLVSALAMQAWPA